MEYKIHMVAFAEIDDGKGPRFLQDEFGDALTEIGSIEDALDEILENNTIEEESAVYLRSYIHAALKTMNEFYEILLQEHKTLEDQLKKFTEQKGE